MAETMYQGIVVEANAFLNFELNTVEDANYGVLIEDGGTVYQMNDNSFLRNNIGIGISSRAIIANDIYSNIFDGTGGLIPEFSGQSPETDDYPLAGIDVHDNVITVGVNGSNTFQTLKNGIISSESSITVENNSFMNMVNGSNQFSFQLTDGNGIVANASNLIDVSENYFQYCYNGISTTNSTLSKVEDNTMEEVKTGIFDRSGRITTRIFSNTISYYYYGIRVLNAERNTNPAIYYNELTALGSISSTIPSIGIQLANAFGTAITHHPEINYNIVSLNGFNIGIETNNVYGVGFYNNEITGSNFKNGIHLSASRSCHLFENVITGTTNEGFTGIHVDFSQDTRYCCNTITNCNRGFYFYGASPRSIWRNNVITTCLSGLVISSNAYFGTQMLTVPAGNSWTTWSQGNQRGINASNGNPANSNQIKRSQIRALGCTLPQWPLYISPTQSCNDNANNWFVKTENSNASCFSDGPCEVNFAIIPIIDTWSVDVAIGAFLVEDFGEMHHWEASRILYSDLKNDQSLLGDDSNVDSFFYANNSGVLNDFFIIDSLLTTCSYIPSGTFDGLKDQVILIDSMSNLLELYADSLIHANNSTDSTIYHNTIVDLVRDAQDINDTLSIDWLNWIMNRDSIVDYIYSLNNLITTSDDIEEHVKAVNHLIFNTIAKGIYVLDSTQEAHDSIIALLCPLEAGTSVYKARILYDLVEPHDYNDSLLCLSAIPIITKSNEFKNRIDYIIAPNPENDVLRVELIICSDLKNRQIDLLDLNGKIIYTDMWSESGSCIKELKSSSIKSGIYFLKINSNSDNENLIRKIIIKH
ncbi:MAG: T9SS type A sorting domain-containing protein [Saprospiraceae bacterium]